MANMINVLIPTKMKGNEHWEITKSAMYAPIKVGDKVIGFVTGVDEDKGVMSAGIWSSNLAVEYEDAERENISAIYLSCPTLGFVDLQADDLEDF